MGRYFTLLPFLICSSLFGQVPRDFTENALPIREIISFRSSALLPDSTEAKLGATFYGGQIKGVRQYYFVGNYVFGKSQQHTTGLQVHVKNRGNLITETSAKIAYRNKIKLAPRKNLFVSANTGIYQLYLESTNTTPGGGDISFDLDVSLGYQDDNWTFSGYLGNVSNPSITIFDEAIIYKRYYGLYAERRMNLWDRKTSSIQGNIYHQSDNIFWQLGFTQEVYKNILLGTVFNSTQLGLSGALIDQSLGKLLMNLHLGFSLPISSSLVDNYTPIQVQLTFTL